MQRKKRIVSHVCRWQHEIGGLSVTTARYGSGARHAPLRGDSGFHRTSKPVPSSRHITTPREETPRRHHAPQRSASPWCSRGASSETPETVTKWHVEWRTVTTSFNVVLHDSPCIHASMSKRSFDDWSNIRSKKWVQKPILVQKTILGPKNQYWVQKTILVQKTNIGPKKQYWRVARQMRPHIRLFLWAAS